MALPGRRIGARDFCSFSPCSSALGASNRTDSLAGEEHHPQPLLCPLTRRTLSVIHKANRAPCLSISLGGQPGHLGYHLLRAQRAQRAGAARYPRGWRCSRTVATAASAAAPGGLRTRQAAGTCCARPFPRCHSDPRCLAPKAPSGTSAIKRQFPCLPAKEQCSGEGGSPEEPTPEAAKGA